MVDPRYLELLHAFGAGRREHSGRFLLDHLVGTYEILRGWQAPEEVCLAGLFHSIYGTEIYEVQSADFGERRRVAEAVGARAEELAYLFCVAAREGLFESVGESQPSLYDRVNDAWLPVSHGTLSALLEIEAANALEQAWRACDLEPEVVALTRERFDLAASHLSAAARRALQDFRAGSGVRS